MIDSSFLQVLVSIVLVLIGHIYVSFTKRIDKLEVDLQNKVSHVEKKANSLMTKEDVGQVVEIAVLKIERDIQGLSEQLKEFSRSRNAFHDNMNRVVGAIGTREEMLNILNRLEKVSNKLQDSHG